MVFRGDRTEVSRRPCRGVPLVREKADNAGRILQDLDNRVEENTIKAGIAEANAVLMMRDKSVQGGPPNMVGWYSP